jgi:hypothetical protein
MIMAMYEERCLHSDVCKYGKKRTNGMYCTGERCLHFIDRTKLADGVKTNAEWMRNMTEEEMVEFIGHNSLCDRVQGEAGNWCNNHNCTDCLREWLKQPAE